MSVAWRLEFFSIVFYRYSSNSISLLRCFYSTNWVIYFFNSCSYVNISSCFWLSFWFCSCIMAIWWLIWWSWLARCCFSICKMLFYSCNYTIYFFKSFSISDLSEVIPICSYFASIIYFFKLWILLWSFDCSIINSLFY